MFLSRYGKPLGKRGVEAIVERIRDAAGIADVRCSPHTFRHSFAVAYLEQGGDIYKLSKELGHGKVHVTEEYIKTLPLSVSRQDHEEFSVIRKLRMSGGRRGKDRSAC
jgi:integrase/recombinase XerD